MGEGKWDEGKESKPKTTQPPPTLLPFLFQTFDENGKASNDFIFEHNCLGGTTLHVRSAPSPACTASMAIADHIVAVAEKDFGWKEGK